MYNVIYLGMFRSQTAFLLSQGEIRKPIADPARHATFLRYVFRVPSHGHLLNIITIQGLSFTAFKEYP